jgi:hypothetical protein
VTEQAPPDDAVVVDVPAEARSLRLLRLAAANAATELDMDIDGVESARIAVDEMAALLLATGDWTRLVVTLRTGAGGLEAHGEVRGPRGPVAAVQVDRVVDELLGTCVDRFVLSDGPTFTFSIDAPTQSPPVG